MDLFDDHFTSILNSFGMTKWTPSITGYPVYGSKVWDEFVNSIWYGELEFYFSTICGLILSILMYNMHIQHQKIFTLVEQTKHYG